MLVTKLQLRNLLPTINYLIQLGETRKISIMLLARNKQPIKADILEIVVFRRNFQGKVL